MTTTLGRATLALDDLLTHPDAAAILGAYPVPTWFADQVAAAATESVRRAERLVAAGVYERCAHVPTTAVPDWVRLGLLDTLVRWIAGQSATCLHAPRPDRPQPIGAAAWKPGLIVCGDCPHLLRLPRGSDADRSCDGCGRVTAGTGADDPIYPSVVQLSGLSYAFGCCRACRYWEAA